VTADDAVRIAALPLPLRWLREPESWHVAEGGSLHVVAGAKTDWFVDPQGSAEPTLNAPALLCAPSGDFLLAARVTVDFVATYDAGVLALHQFVVDGPSVWLRVARIGIAFAFHASTDGRQWRLVRHFALDGAPEPSAGFLAQSPTGEGCAVAFEHISYRADTLGDLRSGA
jgi:regulation of enolase protein 1 (concanavalin A-like superfamily)